MDLNGAIVKWNRAHFVWQRFESASEKLLHVRISWKVFGVSLFTEGGLPYQCVCCHLLHLQSTFSSSKLALQKAYLKVYINHLKRVASIFTSRNIYFNTATILMHFKSPLVICFSLLLTKTTCSTNPSLIRCAALFHHLILIRCVFSYNQRFIFL